MDPTAGSRLPPRAGADPLNADETPQTSDREGTRPAKNKSTRSVSFKQVIAAALVAFGFVMALTSVRTALETGQLRAWLAVGIGVMVLVVGTYLRRPSR